MVVAGAPYTDARLSQVEEVAGGSPYGSGSVEGGRSCYHGRHVIDHFAVDGQRMPSDTELGSARQHGAHVAEMARRMVRGK